MTRTVNSNSLQKSARFAGMAYLIIILHSLMSLLFLPDTSVESIIENEFLFRLDITLSLLMFVGVIILSQLLYRILKSVHSDLARAALFFRVGEGLVGILAVLGNLAVLILLEGDYAICGVEPGELYAQACFILDFYWEVTLAIFVLMALGSIIYFYLFLKSGYIPKAMSIWGMASYGLVLTGALISLLFSGKAYMILGSQTILFELVIGSWLMFKGIKTRLL